jgi:putative transcriptional regulator
MAYHRNMAALLKMTMEEFQALRSRLQLSQADFARMLCVSIRTVQNWEQGRRSPTGPAAALLRIMEKEPHAAIRALHGGLFGNLPASPGPKRTRVPHKASFSESD